MPPLKRKRSWSNSRPAKKKARYYTPKNRYQYARPAMRKETKGMDTPLTQVAAVTDDPTTNTSAVCLNLVRQGAGSWNRVGRKIYNQSLELKGEIGYKYTRNGDNNVSLAQLRMVVVWDAQPNGGVIPNFSDIFGRTDQAGTETFNVYDPPRYDTMSRFTVLKDDFILPQNLVATPTGGTGNEVSCSYPIKSYIKLLNRQTVYQSSSNPSTVADISTGSLLIYFRTTVTAALHDAQFLIPDNLVARLRYTD
ncbi:MAG: coat protein/nuclear export [Cressdnaviricota sp.]|nr:MAG: coat protein/nuclear export [Cressdnaviricota sp.]